MMNFSNQANMPNSSSTEDDGDLDDLDPMSGFLTPKLYWRLMGVVLSLDVLAAAIATGANILTIMVYRRLGFADSTNISLTALALSDLGVAITTFNCVLAISLPAIPNAPFTFEMFAIFSSCPHVSLTRVSALITAYLSVERYLCVLVPLKIKTLITPRRTAIVMVVMFVAGLAGMPATYLRYPVGWRFYPGRNRTLLGSVYVSDRLTIVFGYIANIYSSTFLPSLTLPTVIVCTILLSASLKRSKAWRDENQATSTTIVARDETASKTKSTVSKSKEARAVRMVISIATVFIVSSIPIIVHTLIVLIAPRFDLNGSYSDVYALTGMAFLVLDCVNCSVNVFIYYNMSSKFRHATRTLIFGNSKQ